MKLKWEIIKTGGLPHLSRLPHLPGVPLPHVMPENFPEINRYFAFFVMRHDWQTANNAFSILGFFFRGKTKITETIFQGHTKIVLTSKQTKKIAFNYHAKKKGNWELNDSWATKYWGFFKFVVVRVYKSTAMSYFFCFYISWFSFF